LIWFQIPKDYSLHRVTLLLVVFLLAGCSFQAVEIQQEQASGLAGELLDGHSFGQTFTPEHDGLSRIDLYTATYARENTQPVIFKISSAPGEQGEALLRLELPAAQISNSGPTVITFPPLPDTAGKRLYFSIESPGSTAGDAITVYREEGDVYPEGQMYVDGEATEGDLAFIAYTEESFTLGDVWDDFYSRASQDRPFFIFYCSILALLLILLVIGLAWSARKRSALEEDEQQS
jgi:hypothetical protein